MKKIMFLIVLSLVLAVGAVSANGSTAPGYVQFNNGDHVSITPSEQVWAVAQFGNLGPNSNVFLAEIECFASPNLDIVQTPVWWPITEAQSRPVTNQEATAIKNAIVGVSFSDAKAWHKVNYEPEFPLQGGQNHNVAPVVQFDDTYTVGQTGYVVCIFSEKASVFSEGEGIIDLDVLTITTR
jgi:hypothetical protein